MKLLQQKLSPLWWTGNIRYFIYFVRELTGVGISLYVIYFLGGALIDPSLIFTNSITFKIVSFIGLASAIFHTITWFWVTTKITPFPLPKFLQLLLFLGLIAAWLVISFFLFFSTLHFYAAGS